MLSYRRWKSSSPQLSRPQGPKHLICQIMRQRPSKQIAHSNEAGENLEREVAMTVDAYFDTFNNFDTCDWLLTLEATASVQDA